MCNLPDGHFTKPPPASKLLHMHARKILLNAVLPLLLAALALLPSAACSDTGGRGAPADLAGNNESTMGRADPGYMQYLEKQSMLYHASRLAPLISGSNMFWRHPFTDQRAARLSQNAGVWVRIHPQTVLSSTDSGPLQQLGSPIFWNVMRKLGAGGVYIAPTGGSGSMWNHDKNAETVNGDDIIQFTFAKNMGAEKDYARIIQQAQTQNCLLGGDIMPAAAGLGPDFFLATRNLRGYPGIFCMLEVPQALWDALPAMENKNTEWQVEALSAEQVQTLAQKGFIAQHFNQDNLPYLSSSGWAATGQVRGADANVRRWLYRYAYSPRRPVFNIYDPSRTADMIFYGSSIYQTGILGNAFTGMQLAPLFGLESTGGSPAPITSPGNYTAALSLSGTLAQQSRAYGGWSWIKDSLPLPLIYSFMQSGPDFVYDSITSPAAEHALLTGNIALLRFMFAEALLQEIDFTRLARTSSGAAGVDYNLPQLRYMFNENRIYKDDPSSLGRRAIAAERLFHDTLGEVREKMLAQPEKESASLLEGNMLYTTPAGIATLALGLPQNGLSPDASGAVRRGHMLLQFFKAMQPGLWMLDGQDLAGSMPLQGNLLQSRGNWNKRLAPMGAFPILTSSESFMASVLGIPKAKTLYGPLDAQSYNPSSALSELAELIKLRGSLGIASGEFCGLLPAKGGGLAIVVTRLQQKNDTSLYALAISNFSREESQEIIDLAALPTLAVQDAETEIELLYGDIESISQNDNNIQLDAPGWSKALVLLKVRQLPIPPEQAGQEEVE